MNINLLKLVLALLILHFLFLLMNNVFRSLENFILTHGHRQFEQKLPVNRFDFVEGDSVRTDDLLQDVVDALDSLLLLQLPEQLLQVVLAANVHETLAPGNRYPGVDISFHARRWRGKISRWTRVHSSQIPASPRTSSAVASAQPSVASPERLVWNEADAVTAGSAGCAFPGVASSAPVASDAAPGAPATLQPTRCDAAVGGASSCLLTSRRPNRRVRCCVGIRKYARRSQRGLIVGSGGFQVFLFASPERVSFLFLLLLLHRLQQSLVEVGRDDDGVLGGRAHEPVTFENLLTAGPSHDASEKWRMRRVSCELDLVFSVKLVKQPGLVVPLRVADQRKEGVAMKYVVASIDDTTPGTHLRL